MDQQFKDINGSKENQFLVCMSASSSCEKALRLAAEMARAFQVSYTALLVKNSRFRRADHARLRKNRNLAEQLGARIVTVYAEDVPFQIAEYARVSQVSKIILSRLDYSVRLSQLVPEVDVLVIPDKQRPAFPLINIPKLKIERPMKNILMMLAVLLLSLLTGLFFQNMEISEANIIMLFILGVLFISTLTESRLFGLLASIFSVILFNYFFTDPVFSLHADKPEYHITFLILFAASLIVSTLTIQVKNQAREMSIKAYRTEVLLETSQKLQQAQGKEEIYSQIARQMIKLLDKTVLLYPVMDGALEEPRVFPAGNSDIKELLTPQERSIALWACKYRKQAGSRTICFPMSKCLYLPAGNGDQVFAVVAVAMDSNEKLEGFDKSLLVALVNEGALALEKEDLTESNTRIAVQAKQEELRANLLRTISHDLRTPLTSISGNAAILMTGSAILDEPRKQQLYTFIYDDSVWLINLVENLLWVTRLEDRLNIHMEPELLEDVVQEALRHVSRHGPEHPIRVRLEDDFLMARMDSRLINQVIINLVNNAMKYTPAGSEIEISAKPENGKILVCVADNGPGIPDDSKEKVFDMFYTADNQNGDGRRSMGLGLALCKSIITLHGGTIRAEDNQPHGAMFLFTLQAEGVQ